MKNIDRIAKMISMYKVGNTLEQIGVSYGLCRERVRQLIKSEGIVGKDGGVHIQRLKKINDKKEKLLCRWLPNYGCTKREYLLIMGNVKIKNGEQCLAKRYFSQKRNSKQRGIDFKLTFPQWHKIWIESGHISNIGTHRGQYVMERIGDVGAYELGNVRIVTCSENIKSRSASPNWIRFISSRKTKCLNGHTKIKSKDGIYICQECRTMARKKYNEKRRIDRHIATMQ